MSTFRLVSPLVRSNAVKAIGEAPDGWVVTLKAPTRSNEQNARLWSSLSDVANSKPEGRQWTPETWKAAFLHSLGHQVRFAEGLDGSGPFPMGFSSSKLTVAQMTDLLDTIYAYGAQHGVVWTESDKGGFMDLAARSGQGER